MNFEEIYEQYFSYIYKYILKLSGSRDIADEITSETFLKALKSIDKFKGECSVSSWLCQIAKNSFYSYTKRNKYAVSLDEDETLNKITDYTQNIESNCINKAESDRAKEHLHNLGEPYKEVFMWRFYGEMSFKQIGELFGKNENWACVTYYRARKMLKEKMEGK